MRREGSLPGKVGTEGEATEVKGLNPKNGAGDLVGIFIGSKDNANRNLLDPLNVIRESQTKVAVPCRDRKLQVRAHLL